MRCREGFPGAGAPSYPVVIRTTHHERQDSKTAQGQGQVECAQHAGQHGAEWPCFQGSGFLFGTYLPGIEPHRQCTVAPAVGPAHSPQRQSHGLQLCN